MGVLIIYSQSINVITVALSLRTRKELEMMIELCVGKRVLESAGNGNGMCRIV